MKLHKFLPVLILTLSALVLAGCDRSTLSPETKEISPPNNTLVDVPSEPKNISTTPKNEPSADLSNLEPKTHSAKTITQPMLEPIEIDRFLSLLNTHSSQEHQQVLDLIEQNWQSVYVPMSLEILYFISREDSSNRLITMLEKNTGQNFKYEVNDWFTWWWKSNPLSRSMATIISRPPFIVK